MSFYSQPAGYASLGAMDPRALSRRVSRRRRPRAIAARRRPYYFRRPMPAVVNNYIGDCGDPMCSTYYTDGLGFSLKPPKFIRRAAKRVGRFVKKHETALLVGAGVLTAGLLAPGAALAIGKGALVAGKFAGRELAAGGRGLFKLGKRLLPRQPMQPSDQPEPNPTPSGTQPSAPAPPAAPQMPDLSLPTGAAGGGMVPGSGGDYGGGAPSLPGDVPGEDAVPASQTEAGAKPGLNPMLILGGVALLGLAVAGGRASRKR